ncbi:class I SAM-dependent methyltransferase [Nisaea sp.]|uniref:class I SAM-dependent methyltransferase n=1 Tax=Nisaea sp. TaxID=2024842 RepID=UPI0032995684
MSGFSDAWLRARANWDGPARNRTVEDALRVWAGGHADRLVIVDLGAGNGNNQRHLAPLFSLPVDWLLVDNDPALLAAADSRAVLKDGDRLACRTTDLGSEDLEKLIAGADLVTASALFDLVSMPWLDRMLDALEKHSSALLAVLTYDGRMEADVNGGETGMVRRLFNRHQQGDKGLGPALGPEAASALSARLRDRSYDLFEGDSDWSISVGDPGADELVSGWVSAASEIAPELASEISSWGAKLLDARGSHIRVGHRDHFAIPRIN